MLLLSFSDWRLRWIILRDIYFFNALQNGGKYGNGDLRLHKSLKFLIPFKHFTPPSYAETEAPEAVTYQGPLANTEPANTMQMSTGNSGLSM